MAEERHQGPAPEVLDAFAAFSRSLKRIALYRHARDKHASYLEPALVALSGLLQHEPVITVAVEPNALLVSGATVYSEMAREESLCFRLHRDGVRSISFSRGLTLRELLTFTEVALPDERRSGREDAVTELWKADLVNVSYAAISGYRMEQGEEDRERLQNAIGEVAGRAEQTLQRFTAGITQEDELAFRALPPMLGASELRQLDPAAVAPLMRRSVRTVLDIVERGYASRDLGVLTELLGRLIDELMERCDDLALEEALKGAALLEGKQAAELRALLGVRLADLSRLAQILEHANQLPSFNTRVVPHWLALLPPGAGGVLLDALEMQVKPSHRVMVARAAAARLEGCRSLYQAKLRFSPTDVSRALLVALRELPSEQGAQVAAPALLHDSSAVRRDALTVVASDPQSALTFLRPILGHDDVELRVAAAEALGKSQRAEEAAAVLLEAMTQSGFPKRGQEEQSAFHRALGNLHSQAGLEFLRQRLVAGRRSIFGVRKKAAQLRHLAVQGLVADGSPASLEQLELVAQGRDEVADAARAAARRVRQALGRGTE